MLYISHISREIFYLLKRSIDILSQEISHIVERLTDILFQGISLSRLDKRDISRISRIYIF